MEQPGKRPEPEHLKRGREHDREQKAEWRRDALDIEFSERPSAGLDRLSEAALRRRIARYVAQIESYMSSPDLEFDSVQTAVQFQRRPTIPGRAEAVEDAFNAHGISCVWLDA